MNEILTGLVIAAVVILVLVRRFGARQVAETKLLILPLVVGFIGIRQGRLLDQHHLALSTGLFAVEVAVAVAMGLGLGLTMRMWRETDGSLWTKGTKTTVAVFVTSLVLRGGLAAAGLAMGVHTETGALLVSVAVWLLAQNAAISWRVRTAPELQRATVLR
jgi:Protein of unknown function (DUF1453)